MHMHMHMCMYDSLARHFDCRLCASRRALCVIHVVFSKKRATAGAGATAEPLLAETLARMPGRREGCTARTSDDKARSCPLITCWRDAVSVAKLHLHVAAVVVLRAEAQRALGDLLLALLALGAAWVLNAAESGHRGLAADLRAVLCEPSLGPCGRSQRPVLSPSSVRSAAKSPQVYTRCMPTCWAARLGALDGRDLRAVGLALPDRLAVVVLLDQARVRESAALVAVVELVVVARHRNLRAVLSDRRRPSTLLVSEAATLGSKEPIFGTSSQAHAPEGSPEPLPIRWMAAWAAARGQQHVDHAMVADGLDDSAAWLPAARAGWVDEGDRDSGAGLASPL